MRQTLLVMLAFFMLASRSSAAPAFKEEVKNGNMLYNEGSYEAALEEYEKALLNSPDSDVINYNMGTALYKLGEYKAAISHFEKALVSESENLEQKASYNIANTKYLYGVRQEDINIENAAGILEQSLRHYEHALGLNTKDADAEHNHRIVKKDLDRLREKMKQEKKDQQKQEDLKEAQRSTSGREKEEEQEEEQMTGSGGRQEQAGEKGEDQEVPDLDKEEIKDSRGNKEEGLKSQSGEEVGEGSASEQLEEETEGDPEGKPSSEQLSGVEALGILNNYSQEEEPKGLYKEKLAIPRTAPIIKDW